MSIQVTITGHLTDAADAGLTRNGKAVAHFTVMSNARYRDTDTGEWVDASATAVRVTCWGKLAEAAAELGKGAKVTVVGHKVTADGYVNRDGEAAASLEVIADTVQLDLRQPAGHR